MRRLRIVCTDGMFADIYDAETGDEVTGVLEARIVLSGDARPVVWLRVDDVQLDIIATEQDEPPFADTAP